MNIKDYSKGKSCPTCEKPVTNRSTYCSKHVPRTKIWRERAALSKRGDLNPQWRNENLSYSGLHARIRRNLPKPELCECCHLLPPIDLANISQEYKYDLADWEWLCRSCHMNKDDRIKNLKVGDANEAFMIAAHSPESRAKMAETKRGKQWTPVQREAIMAARKKG